MGVVRIVVGCAVAASLLSQALPPQRRAALWAATRAALDEAAGARASRPGPAPSPLPAVAASAAGAASAADDETVAPDRLGQFETTVEIDGQRLAALVDTGASFVVLRAEDADRLGIRPFPSDYRVPVSTANGRALVARVELPSVRLGAIELRAVPALVAAPGQLGRSLLGMSFLSRLSSVRMDRGRMVLSR